MPLSDLIKNHAVVIYLGTAAVAYGAGFASYKAMLEATNQTTVIKGRLEELISTEGRSRTLQERVGVLEKDLLASQSRPQVRCEPLDTKPALKTISCPENKFGEAIVFEAGGVRGKSGPSLKFPWPILDARVELHTQQPITVNRPKVEGNTVHLSLIPARGAEDKDYDYTVKIFLKSN